MLKYSISNEFCLFFFELVAILMQRSCPWSSFSFQDLWLQSNLHLSFFSLQLVLGRIQVRQKALDFESEKHIEEKKYSEKIVKQKPTLTIQSNVSFHLCSATMSQCRKPLLWLYLFWEVDFALWSINLPCYSICKSLLEKNKKTIKQFA